MAWLGAIYFFGGIALIISLLWFVNRRISARIMYNQRRRQVERAMHYAEYDRQVIEDVLTRRGYAPRRQYQRR